MLDIKVFAGLVLLYVVFQRWKSYSRLKHFNGPVLASLSKLWLLRRIWASNAATEIARVCAEYGSPARIGPNNLVTADIDTWHRINNSWAKSDWYAPTTFDPTTNHRNIVGEIDLKKHEKLRSKLAPGYSGKGIPVVEERVDTQLLRFIQLIETKYKSSRSSLRAIDLARKVQYFTVDSIAHIAFGEPFDDLGQDEDVHHFVATVESSLDAMAVMGAVPQLFYLVSLLLKIVVKFSPSIKDKLDPTPLSGIARKVVQKRFALKEQPNDMLGSFIKAGLTQQEAEAESIIQLVAGSDTTASALRGTLLYIITQPRVYRRLLQEIDATESTKPVIAEAEAIKLPYLAACIKEGLRLHPPATSLIEKESPSGGEYIGGKFVPGGTHLGFSFLGALQSTEIFGDDANVFRPERWLEEEHDEERLARMSKAVSMVFGTGRFGCLGKSLALMELRKVIFELLRRYDISILNPYNPVKSKNQSLWIESDMWVRIVDRT